MRASLLCSLLSLPSNDFNLASGEAKMVRSHDVQYPLSQLLYLVCLVFSQSGLQPQPACTWCTVGAAEHAPAEEAAAPDYKVVVALCAAVSLICSIDRASISVAIVPMAEQYGWSDSVKGAISSSFFLGYTITNLIGTTITHSLHTCHPVPCCIELLYAQSWLRQPTPSIRPGRVTHACSFLPQVYLL